MSTLGFKDALRDASRGVRKISQREFLAEGTHPIIDQGQQLVAGYSNEDDGLCNTVPAIVFGDHTRCVKYVEVPFFAGADGVKILAPVRSSDNPRYLYHALRAADIPSLGYSRHFKLVKELSFVVPERSQQDAIVSNLDAVEEQRQQAIHQIEKLDQLIKSRFVEMFGEPHEMDQWQCCNVSEIAKVTVGVVVKPAQYYVEEGQGVRAFRSLNIAPMQVKDESWVYFSNEGNEKNKKSQLHAGDVVLVRSGAPGVACVVTPEYEGCNSVDIIIARLDKSRVDPVFFAAFMNFPHGQVQISDGTGGSAQQHFNVGTCKKIQFMLPPIALQQKFAAFVQQVDKLKADTQLAIDKLQLLYDSLAQEYFAVQ